MQVANSEARIASVNRQLHRSVRRAETTSASTLSGPCSEDKPSDDETEQPGDHEDAARSEEVAFGLWRQEWTRRGFLIVVRLLLFLDVGGSGDSQLIRVNGFDRGSVQMQI